MHDGHQDREENHEPKVMCSELCSREHMPSYLQKVGVTGQARLKEMAKPELLHLGGKDVTTGASLQG